MDTRLTFPPVIENEGARGRVVLCCEHASNALPAPWGDLGLTAEQTRAHIAWDPGALGLARALVPLLDAVLVHAQVSRLIYDINRAPDMAGAMPPRSEVHDIPGNAQLSPADRALRTRAVYLPFAAGLRATLMERLALGLRPVLVTIHSFTPVYFGKPRDVEFGVIHDADPRLARSIVAHAAGVDLVTRINEPYSAKDDVTHTLAVQATPYGLPNAMLELRNDLIATPDAQTNMAALLAPIIARAVAELTN
ncbi:MAG: N-formylglutamate amidohydrolase [Rhodobacteraceae bacterium]|nr:N-formylglutamate amidohydrolase [Paracoccaceae bacterium]